MKNVIISTLTRTHHPARYVWPVQSASQFVSAAVALSLGAGGIAFLIRTFDPSVPATAILVPAVVCGCWPLYAVLPARLLITTGFSAAQFVNALGDCILGFGYRDGVVEKASRHYRLACPRWRRWRENEITIAVSGDHTIEVHGPVFALHTLKRRLEQARLQS